MAAINDNAGIFTGPVLDLFNQMQVVVQRDGDVPGAQLHLTKAMNEVVAEKIIVSGSGRTYTKRQGQ